MSSRALRGRDYRDRTIWHCAAKCKLEDSYRSCERASGPTVSQSSGGSESIYPRLKLDGHDLEHVSDECVMRVVASCQESTLKVNRTMVWHGMADCQAVAQYPHRDQPRLVGATNWNRKRRKLVNFREESLSMFRGDEPQLTVSEEFNGGMDWDLLREGALHEHRLHLPFLSSHSSRHARLRENLPQNF